MCLIYFVFFLFFSIVSFLVSLNFMVSEYMVLFEYEVLTVNSCSIMMTILLDWMSLLFMSFVLFISSMVIYYSEEYMEGDVYINRFIMLVSMFVLSMMLLIISPNIISILLGWDGLGLVSYALVIYYQNVKSYNAGMITALTNRIGDVALLMAIAWMMNYGGFNYIFYVDVFKGSEEMTCVMWLVLLAALTKSAQIPFSSWLPAAMAAPTPVSSLVHSSTLVTAGVYLLIRFNFALSETMMFVLLFVGTMTMFMAGAGANFEFDLKKIIALSTLSQLGLMMGILALGEYKLAFFHLLTHALFKALLFMCAGCMIHNLGNCQDIRYMGGLVYQMPLTCCYFIISNLALCGIPFLAGFYSKDLILEVLSMRYINLFIYFIYYLSTGLTVCYTFRLIYYVLVGDFNYLSLNMISDKGFIMLKGMSGLILLVITGGSMLMWLMFPTPYFVCLPSLMKMLTLLVISMGAWLGFELSKFSLSYSLKSMMCMKTSLFFSNMWNMPYVSTFGVNYYPLLIGGEIYKIVDQGWSEYYGSQNIFFRMSRFSIFLQFLYYNNLKVFMLLTSMWLMYMYLYLFI
uniref:NADH-ubiquinone oxidoreductase chain 5 n=1 Tax=Oryctes rhinoceros TaxID=72550 RepID=A0A7D5BYT2_ORYRH|nr:NADH dehydrogenase subunit 5 [Oryctes rhinoceros]WAT94192.1 NADH dehydrogenase subunit 5 [Oryctes rhinoceros]WDA95533.1 NADH dehydrogenase subunit 5 [Oryctes rhinoceros]WDA95546.1 NADH dehydrogenase subunit 5 [Oryctes rhinoceros]